MSATPRLPDPDFLDSCLDYLFFRRFAAPVLIQVLFWASTAAVIASGALTIGLAFAFIPSREARADPDFNPRLTFVLVASCLLLGVLQITAGPLTTRVLAELAIVQFRIYEALRGRAAPASPLR